MYSYNDLGFHCSIPLKLTFHQQVPTSSSCPHPIIPTFTSSKLLPNLKRARGGRNCNVTSCAISKDGNESKNDEEERSVNDLTDIDMKSMAPHEVKELLLDTIKFLINDNVQIMKVEQAILQLESIGSIPITPEFAELALAGEWDLRFSSMRMRYGGNIRIRDIIQRFDTVKKELVNEVTWSFPSKKDSEYIYAVLSARCSYKLVGPGRLDVNLLKHEINIKDREDGLPHEMPEDMQSVVNDLRQALPMEYFDPSGLSDVSYIEPDFRISRFVGKRLAGVRNIFIRRS